MAVQSVSILMGRDRMCAVLEPFLGYELARERANNIAQVLALAEHDPEGIALSMLRGSGLGDLSRIAAEVSRAWRSVVQPAEQVERVA